MDYSFIRDITIYCAAGSLGDTLPASAWRENPLWQGVLYFPHCAESFMDYIKSGSQIYLSRGNNWDTVRRYIPAFGSANGIFNTRGQGSLYSAAYSGYFPGMTAVSPGISGAPLHIVTRKGEKNAYIYATAGAGDSGAVYAEIQSNGDIIMNTGIKLSLPRFAATASYAYLHGCLLLNGVTEDDRVLSVTDFHINAAWREPTLAGLHIGLFHRNPSTAAATVEFLNRWPLNGRSRFDSGSFLKGVLTGQRLRAGIQDASAGDYADNAENTGDYSVTGDSRYNENSFLSGLPVGFLTGSDP